MERVRVHFFILVPGLYGTESAHRTRRVFSRAGSGSGDNVGLGGFARSASCGVQERFVTEGVPLRWSMSAALPLSADDLSFLRKTLTVFILCCLCCLCCLCGGCYCCMRMGEFLERQPPQPFVELPVIPMSQPGMVQQAQVVAKAV